MAYSLENHAAMKEDLAMMSSEIGNHNTHDQQINAKPAEAMRAIDFDKALIFIRSITVEDVQSVDVLSKNDLYVTLFYEQAPDGYHTNPFMYKSTVKNEAGDSAHWEVGGMEHIQTHSDNVKRKMVKLEVWDKNRIWKDKKIGTASVSLSELLTHGYDQPIKIQFKVMSTSNKLVGVGNLELLLSAPFNWLTCGLHEPNCIHDFLSNHREPSLLNGFGCCLKSTRGQCHLPSGEKLCGIHLPKCCSPDRPSVVNCGGMLYPPTLGDCSSLDEGCGTCGLCSISLKCCGTDCHICPWLHEGCEELEEELSIPIAFEKGRVTINEVKIVHLKPNTKHRETDETEDIDEAGLPHRIFSDHYYFEVQLLDDQGKRAHYYSSKKADNGKWFELEEFYTSSEVLYNHDLEVRLWKKHSVGRDELVGVGANGHDLVSLLKQGYGKSYQVPVALRAIIPHKDTHAEVHTVVAKLEFNMRVDEHVPVRVHTDDDAHNHKGHSSLFFDIQPESCTLNDEMFKEVVELNMSDADAQKLKFESVGDIENLVGYQIELFSRTTSKSKGIWIIAGVRKYRFSNPQYLLKNKEGNQRWDALQKPVIGEKSGQVTTGRPFTLRRKVATF